MANAGIYEELNNVQEEQKMRLEASRFNAIKNKALVMPKIKSGSGAKIGITAASAMLIFAGLVDLIDWLVVGSIPLVGDVLDIFTGLIIYFWVKMSGLDNAQPWYVSSLGGLGTLIELIPGGDLLPTYIAAVLTIILANTSWGKKVTKFVSPI